MAGHSRSKNGVASLAYVPANYVFCGCLKTWMPGTSPGMTEWDYTPNPSLRRKSRDTSPVSSAANLRASSASWALAQMPSV